MRKLMWFTIGFTAACAAGAYLLSNTILLAFGILACALAFLLVFQESLRIKIIAAVLFGFAVGAIWQYGYDGLYLQTARKFDGDTIPAVVTVSDYSYDTDYGIAADCDIVLDGKTFKARVYFNGFTSLAPGDKICSMFQLRLTTPDSLQGATYHPGEGIFLLAYADESALLSHTNDVPVKYYPALLRRQITDILDAAFPEDTVAFARALLLGDSSLLSYEEDTAFKISGIRHVIAVSGLHISILCALIYMLFFHRDSLAVVFGIPILFLFAALAGFTPSVTRACIMQALMIISLQFKKEYDPPTALSFAVLVMLLVNPLTITSVGFQLSVGCIIGIFLFSSRVYDYIFRMLGRPTGKSIRAKYLRWVSGSISVSVSAAVATTPLSAFCFGTVSLVSILTNLLTLWLVSFVFYGIMLVCVIGAIWSPLARLIAWIISWAIRYIMWIARLMSAMPFSAVYTCSGYIVFWLFAAYILFALFLILRKKRPVLFASAVCLLLILAITASWIEPKMDNYRATVLNVGQGQAILLQCDGKHYLVDCGGDSDETAADIVAAQLLSQGITRLDGIVLTHYDADHSGGVLPLLTRIDAKIVYIPDIDDDTDARERIQRGCADRICLVNENIQISSASMKITLYPGDPEKDDNESGLCVLFQAKDCDILITGDRGFSGEQDLLDSTQLPQLELLIAGHHGSKHSTGLALLQETKPLVVAVSAGRDNRYGHPAQELLERLLLFRCSIWRTDLDGTIIFRG